jgi:chorismate synthase
MRDLADQDQTEGDSIGGAIYFECRGVPRGLGAPRFDSFPSRLAQMMYSIPAVNDFEYGIGREARTTAGSEYNEDWEFDDNGDPTPVGNDHGGIQGGITTGDPIYGEVSWHPPVSIPKKQKTVDWETREEKEIQVVGRHDPTLPPRAVPVVEAMLYCTVLDFMLLGGRINPDRLDGQAGEYDTDYHPSSPQNDPDDAATKAEPTEDD